MNDDEPLWTDLSIYILCGLLLVASGGVAGYVIRFVTEGW